MGPLESDTGLSHTSHLRTHSGEHAIQPKGRLDDQGRLKDAFFMVPKAKKFHHLFLFKANVEQFQFLCLPFGLCRSTPVIESFDDSLFDCLGSMLPSAKLGKSVYHFLHHTL